MYRISPTFLIHEYRRFDREFWLSYKTLEKVLSLQLFSELKIKLLKSKKIIVELIPNLDVKTYNIERLLLDKEWSDKSEEAKRVGTNTHELIHNLFCTNLHSVRTDLGIDTDKFLVQLTEEFLKTSNGIFNEFKMEIPIDDDFLLVGIADCIIKDGKHITIIDFKTDDKIPFKGIFEVGKKKSKRMKYPLANLEDAAGVHYLLQLSLYAWMVLQLDQEFIIDNLIIVLIKDMKKKKEFCVEYLKDDVEKLLKWHVKSVRLKTEMDKCLTIKYD